MISEVPGAGEGLGLLCADGRPALGGTLRKHMKFENANDTLRVSLQLLCTDGLHASSFFFFFPLL